MCVDGKDLRLCKTASLRIYRKADVMNLLLRSKPRSSFKLYEHNTEENDSHSTGQETNFLLCQLNLTHSIKSLPGAGTSGVKRQGHEADDSLPYTAKDKNMKLYLRLNSVLLN
jgi:hypothetical protein